MTETFAQRLEIRENCQAGRADGEARLAITPVGERAKLEVSVAADLIASEGSPEYSYHQGEFYAVSERPLCFLRQAIMKGQIQ
jgi:hypothetical protein